MLLTGTAYITTRRVGLEVTAHVWIMGDHSTRAADRKEKGKGAKGAIRLICSFDRKMCTYESVDAKLSLWIYIRLRR